MALPTTDSRGKPVPYLTPEEAKAQLIQARQNKAGGGATDPRTTSASVAANNPSLIDFEALSKDAGLIDFEALSKGAKAGSELATHRWSIRDLAKQRQARLMAATRAEAVPTSEGTVGLEALAGSWGPNRKGDTLTERLAPELTHDPNKPNYAPTNMLKDAASNVIGLTDIAQLGVRAAGNLAVGNVGRAGELAQPAFDMAVGAAKYGIQAPASAVGAVLEDTGLARIPGIGEFLQATGTTRADFERMAAESPFNIALAFGLPLASRVGAGSALKAVREAGLQEHMSKVEEAQLFRDLSKAQEAAKSADQKAAPTVPTMGAEEAARTQAWEDFLAKQKEDAAIVRGERGPFQEVPNEPVLDPENQQYPRSGGPERIQDPNARARGPIPGEAAPSPMEQQPQRTGPVGAQLEPSRPIADIAQELGNKVADIDPRVTAWYERNTQRLAEHFAAEKTAEILGTKELGKGTVGEIPGAPTMAEWLKPEEVAAASKVVKEGLTQGERLKRLNAAMQKGIEKGRQYEIKRDMTGRYAVGHYGDKPGQEGMIVDGWANTLDAASALKKSLQDKGIEAGRQGRPRKTYQVEVHHATGPDFVGVAERLTLEDAAKEARANLSDAQGVRVRTPKGEVLDMDRNTGKLSPAKKGTTASFLGTQEIYEAAMDLATHYIQKGLPYAKWASEMIKQTGIRSGEVLRNLYNQAKGALDAAFAAIDKKLNIKGGPPETEGELLNRLFNKPPKGEMTAADLDAIPGARRVLENIEARQRALTPEDPVRAANKAYFDTIDEINSRYTAGEIDGAEHSALLRQASEAQGQLNRPTLPPEEGMIPDERRKAVQFDYDEVDRRINEQRKKGPTLSMLGGQELYERTLAATKLLGHEVAKHTDDFDSFAAEVRRLADTHGVTISDAIMREAWNSADVRQQPDNKQLIANITKAVVAGTQESSGSRKVGKTIFDGLRRAVPDSWGDSTKEIWANNVINGAEDLWLSQAGSSPTLSRVAAYAPHIFEAATKVATSRVVSYLKTSHHFQNLNTILGESKVMRNWFADLVLHDRAMALITRKAELEARLAELPFLIEEATKRGEKKLVDKLKDEMEDITIPPNTRIPVLSDEEVNLRLNDSRIQAAIKYWHEKMNPDVEALSVDAGVNKFLRGPLDLYNRMRWVDDATASKENMRDRSLPRSPTTQGHPSPWNVRPKGSPSRKTAKGVGPTDTSPENSLFHMIHSTFSARIPSIAVAELRQAIVDSAAITHSELAGRRPPPTMQMGKRMERLEPITLETPNETYYVPAMVSDAYHNVMSKEFAIKGAKAWDLLSNIATTQTIIVPAEAVRHGTNVIQVLATIAAKRNPGALGGGPEAVLSAATLGMSRVAKAIVTAWHLEGPELAAKIEAAGAGGALRVRGYESYGADKGFIMGAAEKIKPLKELKDFVFGDPGSKQGLGGLETRLRLVLWDLIKQDHPEMTNAQLGRLVNESMGTYTKELVPPIAKLLAPFDPFVRAGVAMTKTGIKQMFGFDPSGKFSPWNLVAAYGTVVAAQYYSSLLDEKHRLPFQIPGWRPTYALYFERNGKMVSFGLNDVSGPLSRASNFFGIRGVLDGLHSGSSHFSDIAANWGRGVSNFWFSRIGPWSKTIFHAFGKEPYLTGDGFMSGVPATMAGSKNSPAEENMKLVAKGLIPFGDKLKNVGRAIIDPAGDIQEADIILPDEHLAHVIARVNELFKLPYFPTLHQPIVQERPYQQYRTQGQFEKAIVGIAREARRLSPDLQQDFVEKAIAERMSGELVTWQGDTGPADILALKIILRRLGRTEVSAAKGMRLQEANEEAANAP